MPQSIIIAAFVLGAVLLLIAILRVNNNRIVLLLHTVSLPIRSLRHGCLAPTVTK